MFDTHCHLNFSVFEGKVAEVITQANQAGVSYFVVPGTDLATSKKAVELAKKFEGVYAAVGIHPHHIYQYKKSNIKYQKYISNIKNLLKLKETVAVGEIGLDKHVYKKTKYQHYKIDEEFFKLQKLFFIEQLKLAKEYKKAVTIHNREAKDDLLPILNEHWDSYFSGRMVFHCCEPDFVKTRHGLSLLEFAKTHNIYIGVDGDVFYNKKKQEFVKKVPLDLLVLETDSPFLSPFKKILPAGRQVPNEPKNLPSIAEFISRLVGYSMNRFIEITTENGRRLFLG